MSRNLNWLFFVARRFSSVDRKGRTSGTTILSALGICLGVMSLIVVMSVMNGFQMSFIDSILEINSYHVQIENLPREKEAELLALCDGSKILSVTPYYQEQGLMVGLGGRQGASMVRAVPKDIMYKDLGFASEMKIVSGSFDLSEENNIVIGNTIARNLGLRVGSTVNIAALSGSSDIDLISQNRQFVVKGIFFCGYSEINSSFSFICSDNAQKYFGENSKRYYGIKLHSPVFSSQICKLIEQKIPECNARSYKEFNRSFFGALRMEKNMIFIFLLLIFIVVAVNIFNSMKKLVAQRKDEIAVLSAMGASKTHVRMIFVFRGMGIGFAGALSGFLLGFLVSKNMARIFMLMALLMENNPMFAIYASIPPRVQLFDTVIAVVFGILSAVFASWKASSSVLKMSVSEVLRYE